MVDVNIGEATVVLKDEKHDAYEFRLEDLSRADHRWLSERVPDMAKAFERMREREAADAQAASLAARERANRDVAQGNQVNGGSGRPKFGDRQGRGSNGQGAAAGISGPYGSAAAMDAAGIELPARGGSGSGVLRLIGTTARPRKGQKRRDLQHRHTRSRLCMAMCTTRTGGRLEIVR